MIDRTCTSPENVKKPMVIRKWMVPQAYNAVLIKASRVFKIYKCRSISILGRIKQSLDDQYTW